MTGDAGAPPEPDYTGGQCEITGCRFGGEVATGMHGPPAVAVEIRPTNATSVLGMLIFRNRFNGRNDKDGPTKTSARHAISVAGRLRNSVVMGNYFDIHHGALIHEDDPTAPGSVPTNYFIANAITVPPDQVHAPIPANRVVSSGGPGWVLDAPLASPT